VQGRVGGSFRVLSFAKRGTRQGNRFRGDQTNLLGGMELN